MSADFFAGYLSGALGILVGNPLDILKVRLQTVSNPAASSNPSSLSIPPQSSYKAHFETAGSLLKGLPAPVLTYGALNALLFVTYNRSLSFLDPSWSPNNANADASATPIALHLWTAGALAGFATWIVSAPTELIKCRAQVATSTANIASPLPHHSASGTTTPTSPSSPSSWSIAKQIYATHGLRGLYFGGGITSVRDAVGYGFYFWAYEASSQAWKAAVAATEHAQPGAAALASVGAAQSWLAAEQTRILLCGGLAGIVTWVSIFPLDVVKSRVQTQVAFLLPAAADVPSVVSPSGGQRAVGGRVSLEAALAQVRREKTSSIAEHRPLLSRSVVKITAVARPRVEGAWALARQAYRAEGPGVFWRGLTVCCVRAFVVNAVQWGVYEQVMEMIRNDKK